MVAAELDHVLRRPKPFRQFIGRQLLRATCHVCPQDPWQRRLTVPIPARKPSRPESIRRMRYHMLRDRKVRPVGVEWLIARPAHLVRPDAVVLGRTHAVPAILLVFRVGSGANRVVLRLNFRDRKAGDRSISFGARVSSARKDWARWPETASRSSTASCDPGPDSNRHPQAPERRPLTHRGTPDHRRNCRRSRSKSRMPRSPPGWRGRMRRRAI